MPKDYFGAAVNDFLNLGIEEELKVINIILLIKEILDREKRFHQFLQTGQLKE